MRFPPTSPGSTPRRGRPDALAAWAGIALVASALAVGAAGPKLLPAEQAFRLSARALDAKMLEVRFNVEDAYYLYRDKLRFAVEPVSASVGAPALPPGKPHEDEFFGKVTTYRGLVVIKVPLAAGTPGQEVTLVVDSQGCADAGVCYPPQRQRVTLALPVAGAGPTPATEAAPPRKPFFN